MTMRIATLHVGACADCPHQDDIGRCSLLDTGKDPAWTGFGILPRCPLPKVPSEEDLKAMLDSMCLTYRHDFGLLSDEEKDKVRNELRGLFEHHVKPLLNED